MSPECSRTDQCAEDAKDRKKEREATIALQATIVTRLETAVNRIEEIKEDGKEANKAQWVAINALTKALNTETTERKVGEVGLIAKIRMSGYAKIVAFIGSAALLMFGAVLRYV